MGNSPELTKKKNFFALTESGYFAQYTNTIFLT